MCKLGEKFYFHRIGVAVNQKQQKPVKRAHYSAHPVHQCILLVTERPVDLRASTCHTDKKFKQKGIIPRRLIGLQNSAKLMGWESQVLPSVD